MFNKVTIFRKWHIFYYTQQNATNLNISVSQGSVAIYFRCGEKCYILFCWKINMLSSSKRILKIS